MNANFQHRITTEELLKQKEIAVQDLIKKLKESEQEKSIYKARYESLKRQQHEDSLSSSSSPGAPFSNSVLLSSTTIDNNNLNRRYLQELEAILFQFNQKLTPISFLNENLFQSLLLRLFDLLSSYTSSVTKRANIDDLKTKLFDKFLLIYEKLNRYRQYETKNVEYEHKIEQLNLELDSLKQSVNCKKLLANGELTVISSEFMKWKNEMKQLNTKVIEQNQLIRKLVRKYEDFKSEISSTTTTRSVESNNQNMMINDNAINNNILSDESSITSSSLAFETLDSQNNITDNNNNIIEPRIDTNADVEIQVYQCPRCKISISNDVDFDIFTNHVQNCSDKNLSCIFCLKLFDENERDEFMRHVQDHDF